MFTLAIFRALRLTTRRAWADALEADSFVCLVAYRSSSGMPPSPSTSDGQLQRPLRAQEADFAQGRTRTLSLAAPPRTIARMIAPCLCNTRQKRAVNDPFRSCA